MEEVFLEQLVKKKKTTSDKIKIFLIIGGGTVLSLAVLAVMFLAAAALTAPDGSGSGLRQMVFTVGLLLIAFVWYGIMLLLNGLNIEYEYTVTGSEFDIDKVLAKKGRKHLLTVDIQNAVLMARIDDDANNSVYKNPPADVKVLNYSAMSDTGFTYFIDCTIDDKRTIVLWQPTQKMVDALWRYNPRAVKKYV